MAKVKFTAVVADMRNKLNGSVFSKNRSGAYVRTKVTPVNRQTSYQTTVRNRLGTYAQGFRGLTQTQIAAWNAAVDNFKSTDIFGDIKSPSGINLYVKLNANITRAGGTAIATPPLPVAVTPLTVLSAVADASDGSVVVTFAPTPVPAGFALVISMTKQLSPGKTFTGGQFVDIVVIAAAGTSPSTTTTNYTGRFGTIVVGQKIGVQIQLVNITTGQAGVPLRATCIAQA